MFFSSVLTKFFNVFLACIFILSHHDKYHKYTFIGQFKFPQGRVSHWDFAVIRIGGFLMALVTCPDCGKPVSNLAPSCIHCGRPIQNELIEINPDILAEIANGKRISCQDGLCTGIIGKDGTCKTCGRPYIETDKTILIKRNDKDENNISQLKCPYCNKEISYGSVKCDNCNECLTNKCTDCGVVLKTGTKFCSECGVMQIDGNESEKKSLKIPGAIIITFVMIFIFFAISDYSPDNPNNASNNISEKKAEAQVECNELIKKHCKYGVNISFFDGAATETGNVILVRYTDLEIGNAFGAKIQSTALCTYDIKSESIVNLRINNEKIF